MFLGRTWQTATPQSQGFDPVHLTNAVDYLRANAGGVGTDEMVGHRRERLLRMVQAAPPSS